MDEVVAILRSAQRRADAARSSYVNGGHLDPHQLDRLAYATLAFLRSRPATSSTTAGWTQIAASRLGVLPRWAELPAWTPTKGVVGSVRSGPTSTTVSRSSGTSSNRLVQGSYFTWLRRGSLLEELLVERVGTLTGRGQTLGIDAPTSAASCSHWSRCAAFERS